MWAVAVVALGAAALTFRGTARVAETSGAVEVGWGWIVPLVVEAGVLAFAMVAWNRSGDGETTVVLTGLMGSLLALSVVINIAHASTGTALGKIVAAAPPLVLLAAVEVILHEHRRTSSRERKGVQAPTPALKSPPPQLNRTSVTGNWENGLKIDWPERPASTVTPFDVNECPSPVTDVTSSVAPVSATTFPGTPEPVSQPPVRRQPPQVISQSPSRPDDLVTTVPSPTSTSLSPSVGPTATPRQPHAPARALPSLMAPLGRAADEPPLVEEERAEPGPAQLRVRESLDHPRSAAMLSLTPNATGGQSPADGVEPSVRPASNVTPGRIAPVRSVAAGGGHAGSAELRLLPAAGVVTADELVSMVRDALGKGSAVTGPMVSSWLQVSESTALRRLRKVKTDHPDLARRIEAQRP